VVVPLGSFATIFSCTPTTPVLKIPEGLKSPFLPLLTPTNLIPPNYPRDDSLWNGTARCGDYDRDLSILSTTRKGSWSGSHTFHLPESSTTFTLSCLFLVETNSSADTSPMDVSRHESFPRRYPGSTRTTQPSLVLLDPQAGCHLVDLFITSPVNRAEFKEFSSNFMIQVIRPRAEGIRSLYLSFEGVYDLCCLLQYQDDEYTLPHHVWSFPNLEYLTFDLYDYPDDDTMLTALQSMPKLHTVVVNNLNITGELIGQLPWAQLTSLEFNAIPASLFGVLMTQCPALETGGFGVRDRNGEEDLLRPIVDVSLTRLTTLKVDFFERSGPAIFDGIRFPALDDFTLVMPSYREDFVWTAPEHMFRQLARIATLSLGNQFAPRDMIHLLRQTKNVTAFRVVVDRFDRGNTEFLLKALTLGGRSDDEVLLPKLVVMRLRINTLGRRKLLVVTRFVKMVASRSPSGVEALGVAPLREVWVDIPAFPNTLKVDMDAVLEQWGHKTDMPHIRYERHTYNRQWDWGLRLRVVAECLSPTTRPTATTFFCRISRKVPGWKLRDRRLGQAGEGFDNNEKYTSHR